MSDLRCFLIGPNGSGKSTVGRILANFLSLKFIDSDFEIEHLVGGKIKDFLVTKGIKAFSQLESIMLKTLSNKKNTIFEVSVNSLHDAANRHLINLKGKIIYLSASPINQYTRTMLSNRHSPILSTIDDKLIYLIELAKTMEPLYNSIADLVIPTDNYTVEDVVNKIIDYLYFGIYSDIKQN